MTRELCHSRLIGPRFLNDALLPMLAPAAGHGAANADAVYDCGYGSFRW